jgi:N-acetylglucosamine-6-phosphate deacetylase
MKHFLHAARLYDGFRWWSNACVMVDRGNIVYLGHEWPEGMETGAVQHFEILVPGFVDLQIYGGHGKLFSQYLDLESLEATAAYCREGGVAHFMITLATNASQVFDAALNVVAEKGATVKGLLGVHLEGPYIHPSRRGAHLLEFIHPADVKQLEHWLDLGKGSFRMITLAPEVSDMQCVRMLLDSGVIVSAGHSNATYEEAMAGFDWGIPAATHLFNAMSPLMHRAPGLVGAVMAHPQVMSSMVYDGIHVLPPVASIAQQVMGDRLFFITDAVTATTEGPYQHVFQGDHYALADGTLSGSALHMHQCIRQAVAWGHMEFEAAVRKASVIPGQLVAHRKIGRIAEGYEAAFNVYNTHYEHQRLVVY